MERAELTPVERLECERVAERLAVVYDALRWKWWCRTSEDGGEESVPDASRIEACVRDLAEQVIASDNPNATIATGGLLVLKHGFVGACDEMDPNHPANHLRFIVRFEP